MSQQTVRVGILGFGSRGVSLVAPILDNNLNNQIAVIIDPDESRARYYLNMIAEQGQIPRDEAARVRFAKSLDELRPGEVDALFLTASEIVRSRVFAQAVQTGAHLYMEKGLAPDLEGGRRVVQGMKLLRPGQQVFMGFNLRHFPPLVHAKRILDSGRLGKPLYIHYVETLTNQHGGSFYMRFHRDVKNSGGMLVTKACHDFDMIGHLLGARPQRVFSSQHNMFFGKGGPQARQDCRSCDRTADCEWDRLRTQRSRAAKRKYAQEWTDADKVTTDGYCPDACVWRSDTQVRDLSQVLLQYANGLPANYTQVLFSPKGNRVIQVFCEQGSLVFDESSRSLQVADRWNTTAENIAVKPGPDGHGGSDTGVVEAFFRSIRQGVP
ncbi:MAG TPA: Gfo/Idh/MocA family oxidoreductase, partial [Candidatus Brocadiia bacterium]|nr:Gfo/Idh/MocA family oxidoreductase [Candidatus Brocadiia bacterium]